MLSVDFPNHTFTLTGAFHSDGDSTDQIPPFDLSLSLLGQILNEPPSADAGPSQTVECTSPQGALITLDGRGSTDPDQNILGYSWFQGQPLAAPAIAAGSVVQVEAPGGGTASVATTYGLLVQDAYGQMSVSETTVTVLDTAPPAIEGIAVQANCLWPPNHEMVLLRLGQEIQVTATDPCDLSPVAFIKSVTDSQPFLGGGSGDASPDFEFGSGAVCLRSEAERDGTQSSARTYTVTVGVGDSAGNESDQAVTVVVPHDQAHVDCPALPASAFVADGDRRVLRRHLQHRQLGILVYRPLLADPRTRHR